MEHGASILRDLFVMFAAAKVLAEIAERIRQPTVVAEILGGLLIGPNVLGLVRPGEVHDALAELGVVFLLFVAGLEVQASDVFSVGATALAVAFLGVALPFAGGFALMHHLGRTGIEATFVGAALVATSVGITARVFADMGLMQSMIARVVLAAAVIDDILGMIVLAIVSSLSAGSVDYARIAIILLEAVVFTALAVVFGERIVRRLGPTVANLRMRESYFIGALLLCLGLSALASYFGIAAIIGAFLAGMALSGKNTEYDLDSKMFPVYEFLVPLFFVVMGMRLDVTVLWEASNLGLAAAVTFVAIVTKIIACSIGAARLGWMGALTVGIGMVPRGEVGIVVALVGLQLGTIPNSLYAVVITMSMATTLVVPPALKFALSRR